MAFIDFTLLGKPLFKDLRYILAELTVYVNKTMTSRLCKTLKYKKVESTRIKLLFNIPGFHFILRLIDF